jgi:hypothetical protein
MKSASLLLEKQANQALQRIYKRIDYLAAEAKLELAALAHSALLAINRRAGQHKRRLLERLGA